MTSLIECTLQRISTLESGTIGTFNAPALPFSSLSLELPDRNNTPMISRIPAGVYPAAWVESARFKRTLYRLQNPPGRTGILIHPANFAGDKDAGLYSELSGCIALGSEWGSLINPHGQMQAALLESRAAVSTFERLAAGRPLIITIIDEPAEGEPPEVCDEQ